MKFQKNINSKLFLIAYGIIILMLFFISYNKYLGKHHEIKQELENRIKTFQLVYPFVNSNNKEVLIRNYFQFLNRDDVSRYSINIIKEDKPLVEFNSCQSDCSKEDFSVYVTNNGEKEILINLWFDKKLILTKTLQENISYFFIVISLLILFQIAIYNYLAKEKKETQKILKYLSDININTKLKNTESIFESINNTFLKETFVKFVALVKELNEAHEKLNESSKLAAIGQTAAMLAHDVRKPFASVKALLANLNFFIKYPEKLEIAQKDLNKTISNVENMIADIMDFSRTQKYELKECDIKEIINASVLQAQSLIDSSKHTINFITNFEHNSRVMLEENKMQRVFQNIFANAVEAITVMGQKNQGQISVSTSEVDGFLNVRISNDGPHFEPGTEETIFESSFTSGKNSGTGLGLASVKKIIELHGGKIIAKNLDGKYGVEFYISLMVK